MDLTLAHIKEGQKMLKRALSNKPFRKYEGSATLICRQIIEDCWNGRYFQVSSGHFDSFYVRDFSYSVEGLINFGYRHEVLNTLEWALEIYKRWGMLTTTITADEKPINVFNYAPDTLPLLLRTLRVTGTKYIINEHIDFLNEQIRYYYDYVLDKEKGIVDPTKKFSSMRDHYTRKSSMYDNSMLGMLPIEIEKIRNMGIKLTNPFRKYNFAKSLRDRFWVGTHFLDDLSMDTHIATDANVLPFYCEIFNDKDMMWSSMTMIQKYQLDRPLPAKYTKQPQQAKENALLGILAPNYEGDSCWTLLGLLYMYMIKKIEKNQLRRYVDIFEETIEKYHNFLEVFDKDGNPYRSTFYKCDEGMIWAAMYLDLENSLM